MDSTRASEPSIHPALDSEICSVIIVELHLILLKPQTTSASPRAAAPIDIVEIGTESGRCFKDLFERANDTGTPFPHIQFYSIDPSVPMLKRAIA